MSTVQNVKRKLILKDANHIVATLELENSEGPDVTIDFSSGDRHLLTLSAIRQIYGVDMRNQKYKQLVKDFLDKRVDSF